MGVFGPSRIFHFLSIVGIVFICGCKISFKSKAKDTQGPATQSSSSLSSSSQSSSEDPNREGCYKEDSRGSVTIQVNGRVDILSEFQIQCSSTPRLRIVSGQGGQILSPSTLLAPYYAQKFQVEVKDQMAPTAAQVLVQVDVINSNLELVSSAPRILATRAECVFARNGAPPLGSIQTFGSSGITTMNSSQTPPIQQNPSCNDPTIKNLPQFLWIFANDSQVISQVTFQIRDANANSKTISLPVGDQPVLPFEITPPSKVIPSEGRHILRTTGNASALFPITLRVSEGIGHFTDATIATPGDVATYLAPKNTTRVVQNVFIEAIANNGDSRLVNIQVAPPLLVTGPARREVMKGTDEVFQVSGGLGPLEFGVLSAQANSQCPQSPTSDPNFGRIENGAKFVSAPTVTSSRICVWEANDPDGVNSRSNSGFVMNTVPTLRLRLVNSTFTDPDISPDGQMDISSVSKGLVTDGGVGFARTFAVVDSRCGEIRSLSYYAFQPGQRCTLEVMDERGNIARIKVAVTGALGTFHPYFGTNGYKQILESIDTHSLKVYQTASQYYALGANYLSAYDKAGIRLNPWASTNLPGVFKDETVLPFSDVFSAQAGKILFSGAFRTENGSQNILLGALSESSGIADNAFGENGKVRVLSPDHELMIRRTVAVNVGGASYFVTIGDSMPQGSASTQMSVHVLSAWNVATSFTDAYNNVPRFTHGMDARVISLPGHVFNGKLVVVGTSDMGPGDLDIRLVIRVYDSIRDSNSAISKRSVLVHPANIIERAPVLVDLRLDYDGSIYALFRTSSQGLLLYRFKPDRLGEYALESTFGVGVPNSNTNERRGFVDAEWIRSGGNFGNFIAYAIDFEQASSGDKIYLGGHALALDSEGGELGSFPAVVRLRTSDGELDSTFGTNQTGRVFLSTIFCNKTGGRPSGFVDTSAVVSSLSIKSGQHHLVGIQTNNDPECSFLGVLRGH